MNSVVYVRHCSADATMQGNQNQEGKGGKQEMRQAGLVGLEKVRIAEAHI